MRENRTKRAPLIAGINITPFTDVVLVLLIIFMIATPLLIRSEIKVNLPRTSSADTAPQKNLAPAAGSSERYKLQEWLNFIASELHKNFSPMFQPVLSDDTKAFFKTRLEGKFKYIDHALSGRDYLMGGQFTVPDAYLFTMLAWADRMGLDISGLPNLTAYKARVAARPKVQEALTAEGLLKAS